MSQKSTEQNVKDVISASSRAISKDKDLNLEVNYLQQVAEPGHNLQENIESIQLSRGDADRHCLLYTSPSPRDRVRSRMPSSA